ncbi:hypothetical protein GPUN_2842 [Glaciecola punicea ACAM 611]|uniref:Uncharacterized protein n=1 Tax=Glaciecola punicea ACAM 611 TaxID=1121923 RepID=H5TF29_9ALTE|nr:hypothetical protein GPUN_2842 [Glaciecola punicea ACAM 611]
MFRDVPLFFLKLYYVASADDDLRKLRNMINAINYFGRIV